MDQRAYATLFPREHFEKFICGSAKKDDDVAARQHQQQQMVLPGVRPEGHRPLGRARRVQFGHAELGNTCARDNGAGVLCHLKSSKGGKKTTVLCASRLERAKVNPRFPEEGFVEVNVEIGACSRVENGSFSSSSERATRVARLIRETVFPRKGGLLDWNVLKGGGGGGGGKSSSGEKDACWKLWEEYLEVKAQRRKNLENARKKNANLAKQMKLQKMMGVDATGTPPREGSVSALGGADGESELTRDA